MEQEKMREMQLAFCLLLSAVERFWESVKDVATEQQREWELRGLLRRWHGVSP